jgi:hypothetical protein
VLLAALLLLQALAPCALCCVLVCLIHPRRGRLSRVIGNKRVERAFASLLCNGLHSLCCLHSRRLPSNAACRDQRMLMRPIQMLHCLGYVMSARARVLYAPVHAGTASEQVLIHGSRWKSPGGCR